MAHSDQKTEQIVKLLCEEIVPLFRVPETLLTDRDTNQLSHLMLDMCALLGTVYHPVCDRMVERYNSMLKSMLHKRTAQFGAQWDKSLAGVLWAYHSTPYESTGENSSAGTASPQQKLHCRLLKTPLRPQYMTIRKS